MPGFGVDEIDIQCAARLSLRYTSTLSEEKIACIGRLLGTLGHPPLEVLKYIVSVFPKVKL